MSTSSRNTIFVEDALILSHEQFEGEQFILRVMAPKCAAHAVAGQFAHLQCDPQRPMRRPISIMRVSRQDGWVDFLYKRLGEGTALLAERKPGESISMFGPIGKPFAVERKRPLLIGGGVGMPPMIFLAEELRNRGIVPFVILGSEVPFPFTPRPSQIMLDGLPEGVIAGMPLLDDWGIPSRLASMQDFAGCHRLEFLEQIRRFLNPFLHHLPHGLVHIHQGFLFEITHRVAFGENGFPVEFGVVPGHYFQ